MIKLDNLQTISDKTLLLKLMKDGNNSFRNRLKNRLKRKRLEGKNFRKPYSWEKWREWSTLSTWESYLRSVTNPKYRNKAQKQPVQCTRTIYPTQPQKILLTRQTKLGLRYWQKNSSTRNKKPDCCSMSLRRLKSSSEGKSNKAGF